MSACYDCPRACGADRRLRRGACGVGYNAAVAKVIDPFTYEEPCLDRLSAVFFSGCNLGCSYCQNYKISRAACGDTYADGALAALFDGVTPGNALDLVTPTPVLSALERALPLCREKRRIIYNTSGYETADGVRRAAAFTDVFLTDLKYVGEAISKKFSNAPDYFVRASAAIKVMRETPDVFDGETLVRGLVVRHLVLPGCAEDSVRALDWIAAELGTDTVISLMSQFTPNGVGEPRRKLKNIEYKLVAEHALKLGFHNGFFQDAAAADSGYTPDF